jgi:type I restriction enzyme, S subunit
MSEWKTVRLGDVADVQTGPFGSQLHNKDYVIHGTPIVTVEHLGQRKFTIQNLPCVSDIDKDRLLKYTLSKGDVVFSRVGSVDRCSYVSNKEDGWLFSGRCLRIRPQNIINPLYLYYFFCLEEVKQSIRNIAVGATMPSINTNLLQNIVISFPSLNKQRFIGAILSSFDDKIELNNSMNRNLEQQAQAIFREWFMDNAKPEWKEGKLEDIGTIVGGGTPSKEKIDYFTDKGIAWITPKDLSVSKNKFTTKGETDITEIGYKNSSAQKMPRGTVLFSSRAPIGYISIAKDEVCTNQGFKSIIPNKNIRANAL